MATSQRHVNYVLRPAVINAAQELFPYAVQVALEMGVRPNAVAPQGTVERWLGQVRAALRTVWDKITRKPELFKSQDLVNLAFGIAQRENPAYAGGLDGVLEQGDAEKAQMLQGEPVAVLVHRDQNTQRMYLHSVALKENLLKPSVSAVDAKASERGSATTSGDVSTVANAVQQGKAATADVARELNRLLTLDVKPPGGVQFSRAADIDSSMGAMTPMPVNTGLKICARASTLKPLTPAPTPWTSARTQTQTLPRNSWYWRALRQMVMLAAKGLIGRHLNWPTKAVKHTLRGRVNGKAPLHTEGRAGRGRTGWPQSYNPSILDELDTARAFACMAGCGARGGDVLAFHMATTGDEFIEAAKALGCWIDDGQPSTSTSRPHCRRARR